MPAKCLIALLLCGLLQAALAKDPPAPYLVVLGVGQDAGYPQAGCYQPHCLPGWQDRDLRRRPVSLGLIDPGTDSGAARKYLFEATPAMGEQLYELEQLAPSDHYSLAGVFLTHAHIGHYTGLMYFGHEAMGASDVPVYAMPRMGQFLASNGPWSQLVEFNNIRLLPLADGKAVELGQLRVTPFVVPHRDEFSETVGYRIEGPSKGALFIPDINKWHDWDRDLREEISRVDHALIDAAFFDHGELPGRDMSRIPHPFVRESMQLLDSLPAAQRDKVWFIHMNHTNPLLRADSAERAEVEAAGYHVAEKGVRLGL